MFKNEAKANLINLCPSVTFNVLLTSVFLVVFSCFSFAQNVGIGVDDPLTKLDVDGVITGIGGNSSDWNEAYGWGNHNLGGYLLNELDPKVGSLGLNYIPRWNGFTLINGVILDNGSNVGIGGAPRSEKLYVAGTSYLRGNIGIGTTPTLTERLNVLGNTRITGSGYITGNVGIGAPSNSNRLYVNGASSFQGNTITSGTSFLQGNVGIGAPSNSNKLYVNGSTIVIGTTQLSGNVGIGAASTSFYKLFVFGNTFNQGNFSASGSTELSGNVGLATAPPSPTSPYSVVVGGSILVQGFPYSATTSAFTVVSDRRLKKEIHPFEDGLEEVLKIRTVNYRYNEISGYDTNETYVGVIAQEIKELAPYMVKEMDIKGTSYFTLNNSSLPYLLVNAIQEQQEEINELRAKLGEEETALNDLNEKVDALLEQMVKLEASITSKADKGDVDHIGDK